MALCQSLIDTPDEGETVRIRYVCTEAIFQFLQECKLSICVNTVGVPKSVVRIDEDDGRWGLFFAHPCTRIIIEAISVLTDVDLGTLTKTGLYFRLIQRFHRQMQEAHRRSMSLTQYSSSLRESVHRVVV